jgi:hypothetical protein
MEPSDYEEILLWYGITEEIKCMETHKRKGMLVLKYC